MDKIYDRNFKILIFVIWGLFALLLLPFWSSLVLSGIFSLALYPYLVKYKQKKTMPTKIIIGAVSLTTLLIVTPFLLGAYEVSVRIIEFSKTQKSAPADRTSVLQTVTNKVDQALEYLGVPQNKTTGDLINKVMAASQDFILKISTEFLASVPELSLNLIIFTLGLYMFLTYGENIRKTCLEWKIFKANNLDELIDVLHRGSFQCLSSLLIVGTIQSSLVLLGGAIAGFEMLLGIFVITFVLSFIPIIGAAPVAFVLSALEFLDGSFGSGVFLFILAVFVGLVDNIIKPLLIKRGIDMDGAVALITIIGAIVIFGLPGLFLGPIIGTTATYYYHKEKDKS